MFRLFAAGEDGPAAEDGWVVGAGDGAQGVQPRGDQGLLEGESTRAHVCVRGCVHMWGYWAVSVCERVCA
jgi:hypothetical protein